ncbi:MAG: hypothetical protein Q9163_003132 [Psora crenata]
MNSQPDQYEDLFRYTSGRWLWIEENELPKRYRKFNVEELKRESVGALSCVSISKIEGGYNKVFTLVMDNDSVAIARIPCLNAGPAFKTTASEVATIEFVSHSPRCLYGNIYFAEDSFPGCVKAKVSGDIPIETKNEVEERFSIGPVVEHVFWRRERAEMAIERGPYLEKSEKDRVANKVERSLVRHLYEIETKRQSPLLVEMNDIPHGITRRQTAEFSEDTWDGDILPFRQCLIRLER